jgi:hypothetical protein
MIAFKAIFLSCLLLLPSVSCSEPSHRIILSDWIRYTYYESTHHTCKMDESRGLEYADSIIKWTEYFDLDEDRFISQLTWESGFVNNIRDRKLKFESWSYGISGIQVETAVRSAARLHLDQKPTGRDLILDFDLNIRLGAEQMRFLLDKRAKGDQRIAESSYNAGYNGYKLGRGLKYPFDIDWVLKKWKEYENGRTTRRGSGGEKVN